MGAVLTGEAPDVIRMIVIDDHPIVVQGVRTVLEREPSIQLSGDARSAGCGVELARRLQPDVVLLDLRLPDADFRETVNALRTAAPVSKILVFTAYTGPTSVAMAMEAGVDGYVLKDVSESDIRDLVRRAVAGEVVFQPKGQAAAREKPEALTRREIEVVRQVAMGQTNAEAARHLLLAPNTVKAYLQSAMQKLGARNRVEAIARASDIGIL